MKLLVAIVRDDFAADVTYALNGEGYSVTRVSSTGGFWRRGNVTLLVGIDDDLVDRALNIIGENAGPEIDTKGAPASHPPSRATIFVVPVDACNRY